MKKRDLLSIIVSIVITLGSVQFAWAEDFTFNVNVNLSSLRPDVRSAAILCIVIDTERVMPVGRGEVNIPISEAGSYSGPVTVAFNADPGREPNEARRWRCLLVLNDIASDVAGLYPRLFGTRDGTERRLILRGTFSTD